MIRVELPVLVFIYLIVFLAAVFSLWIVYEWRNQQYPVRSSDAGLHTWDDRLSDYAPDKIAARAQRVRELLAKINAIQTANWPKGERIDWLLFRAQLEGFAFDDRVWHSTARDPHAGPLRPVP